MHSLGIPSALGDATWTLTPLQPSQTAFSRFCFSCSRVEIMFAQRTMPYKYFCDPVPKRITLCQKRCALAKTFFFGKMFVSYAFFPLVLLIVFRNGTLDFTWLLAWFDVTWLVIKVLFDLVSTFLNICWLRQIWAPLLLICVFHWFMWCWRFCALLLWNMVVAAWECGIVSNGWPAVCA